MPRISPVSLPCDEATADHLARLTPEGVPPLLLFRTFVKNLPMADALIGWGGYELSESLSLRLRDREILIDRTCALCQCEYEWGVHVALLAQAAALSHDQVASLTHGSSEDSCWTDDRDRLLVAAADQLHHQASLGDDLYAELASTFSEAEILDLLMLCGWYHAISYAANGVQIDLEETAPRFADYL